MISTIRLTCELTQQFLKTIKIQRFAKINKLLSLLSMMKYLSGIEEKDASIFIEKCSQVALKATCLKAKCGSIVVKNNIVIGEGFNSPPGNLESPV